MGSSLIHFGKVEQIVSELIILSLKKKILYGMKNFFDKEEESSDLWRLVIRKNKNKK